MKHEIKTSLTLLERLRSPGDDAAWDRFYDQYAGVILSFARGQGVKESTAEDVLQETVIHAWRALPGFQYDPAKGKFRNWVLTVARFKALETSRRGWKEIAVPEMAPDATQLATPSLPEDYQDWRQTLVAEAFSRLRADPGINVRRFAIFCANAVDGVPAEELSQQFDLKENAIYKIKNDFLNRLRQEIQALAGLEHISAGAEAKQRLAGLSDEAICHALEGLYKQSKSTVIHSVTGGTELRARLKYAATLLAEVGGLANQNALIYRNSDGKPCVVPLGNELVVGRQPGAGLRLAADTELSRKHFRILREGKEFIVEDLASRNGTYVNDCERRIQQRRLRSGDIVLAGGQVFVFVDASLTTTDLPAPPDPAA